jgi:hypothetical protein
MTLSGDDEKVAGAELVDRRPERRGAIADLARAGARIAAGGSPRGLSSVTMARSACRATASPIKGRFSGSRSPPAPNTTMRRPEACGRSARSTVSSASGVWAKST